MTYRVSCLYLMMTEPHNVEHGQSSGTEMAEQIRLDRVFAAAARAVLLVWACAPFS